MNAALAYVYLVNQFKAGQGDSDADIKAATDGDMDSGFGSGYVSTLK